MNVEDKHAEAKSLSRRRFLKAGSGAVLTLGLTQLSAAAAPSSGAGAARRGGRLTYGSWEDVYRKQWSWDKVSFGSHTNACLPNGCLFHIYTRNGLVWREEQAGVYTHFNKMYPDANPMGCQKGCSFSQLLYSDHRITHPIKRVGERGGGQWKRISWEEALTEVADSILDAHKEQGSDSFIIGGSHLHAGTVSLAGLQRFGGLLNSVTPDTTLEIGDCYTGIQFTFGKIHVGYSFDNIFDAELLIVSHANPSYAYTPSYHYLTEARYNGTEMCVLSPEYTPHLYADTHVPLKPGTDPALWMAVCQVIFEEKLYRPHLAFITEQTDLPLLVRLDTQRYLRESDLSADGWERRLCVWDAKSGGVVIAPRKTLAFAPGVEPALEGQFEVTLKDGGRVKVRPVFEVIRDSANAHRPDMAAKICAVSAEQIRELARKVATKRTCCFLGYSSGKFFHSDLSERSLLLAMALSGNWGKPGTGINTWGFVSHDMEALSGITRPVDQGGLKDLDAFKEAVAKKTLAADPDATYEDVLREMGRTGAALGGVVQPTIFHYQQSGYNQLWDNKAWQDPVVGKTFAEALAQGIEKGWWDKSQMRPAAGVTPQVLCVVAANPMRRLRSATNLLPQVLFPKLKMIFAIEPRMSTTTAYADIILPAAWYYEKHDKSWGTISGQEGPAFIDAAVNPAGEAKPEWEIYARLLGRITERARERGIDGFTDSFGQRRKYDDLVEKFTMNGYLKTPENVLEEMMKVNRALGHTPKDQSFADFKKQGWAPYEVLGESIAGGACASDYDKTVPYYPLQWHVEKKQPYPTYARRAQFYLEQEWFIAAGEAAPTFKDIPEIGGNYPFRITGGHPRHSVHTVHQSSEFVNRLHRGQPVVHMNDADARDLGIADSEMVILHNDMGESQIMARVSPNVQRKQLIVYLWEASMFPGWKAYDLLLVGMPKVLWFAGEYEQFLYQPGKGGGPVMASDRGVRIGVRKIA